MLHDDPQVLKLSDCMNRFSHKRIVFKDKKTKYKRPYF